MKLKVESSGWPLDCQNDVQRRIGYIQQFKLKNQIDIDPKKIRLVPNLLYADTNSVFSIDDLSDENRYRPPLGHAVGVLTNELAEFKIDANDELFISKFVCIAPKAYAYQVHRNIDDLDGQQIIKLKG